MAFELSRLGPERAHELEESLRTGRAPPSHWYVERDLFEIERDLVLRRAWHYAAHADELKKIGDQIVLKIAGVPIVLVRDQQRNIRGFVNICRHRAHLVVLQNQNQRSMQCLYHGWTYGLDGCLRAAPRSRTDPRFDPNDFPLLQVQVHQWGPTIWVNLGREEPAFGAGISGMTTHLERDGLKLGDYRCSFEKVWTVRANWKLFIGSIMDRGSGPANKSSSDRRASAGSALHDGDWRQDDGRIAVEGEQVPSAHHWIFPTTSLRYGIDLRGYDIGSVRILDVDRIEFRHVAFVRTDMPGETEERRRHSFERETAIDEHRDYSEGLQRAHADASAPQDKLLPGSEWLLHRLHRALSAPRKNRTDRIPHGRHDL